MDREEEWHCRCFKKVSVNTRPYLHLMIAVFLCRVLEESTPSTRKNAKKKRKKAKF